MTRKSRIFFVAILTAIAVTLVLALSFAGVYRLGQNSVVNDESTSEALEVAELQSSDRDVEDETDAKPAARNTTEATSEIPETETEARTTQPAEATDVPTQPAENGPPDLNQEDFDLLLEVWEIVGREFDGELPGDAEVTYGAIDGTLRLLDDQFTRFVPPEIAARAREQLEGSFEGIGAFVDLSEDGYLLIVRPIKDQPADLAGLLSGDLISHVNGEPVIGKSIDAIIAEVKGPKGTTVVLTIIRESETEPFDVTISRDLIEIPIVESEILADNIAYVRLSSFSGNSAEQLESALDNVLQEDPRALILDLRDNPGGFLSQSVEVADLFLADGVALYQRDSLGEEEIFTTDDGDLAEDVTLVVLVNGGSASASEIVAGAVKDRNRGTLIGETTFGKGSVQQSHTLSDGSELRVTIARWYTPDQVSIDAQGVSPDIAVLTPEEFGGENDTQLQEAIRYILRNE
jgi:carboxyl-terminal processing protease